jgi:hypothetical protein
MIIQLLAGSIVVLPALFVPSLTLAELGVCILLGIMAGACCTDA